MKPSISLAIFLFCVSFALGVPPEHTCRKEIENQKPTYQVSGWTLGKLTTDQEKVLQKAVDAYELDGTLVTQKNCTKLVGHNYGRVMAAGNYREGQRSYHLRIFESTEHFWVLFSQSIAARYRIRTQEWDGSVEIRTAEQSEILLRLMRFSILDVDYSKGEGYGPEALSYIEQRRPALAKEYVRRAVNHLAHYGVLIDPKNCKRILGIPYHQLTGADYYGEGEAGEGREMAIFETSVHFWLDFSKEVDKRRKRSQQEFILNFTIFDVTMHAKRGRDPELFAKVKKLFDAHRPIKQRLVIEYELDVLQQEGLLIQAKRCGVNKSFNLVWDQVFGLDTYAKENEDEAQGYRRYFDSQEAHWIAFEKARQSRLARWPESYIPIKKWEESSLKQGRQREQLGRLEAFTIYDVRIFEKLNALFSSKFEAIYDQHRLIIQQRVVAAIVKHYFETGSIANKSTYVKLTGHEWRKLCGTGYYHRYTGVGARMRVFNSIDDLWIGVENELKRRFYRENETLSQTERGLVLSFSRGTVVAKFKRAG